MLGWFGVCRVACGLFVVGLWFLQRFCWCLVVLAASWSRCRLLGLSCCSRRWRSLMLSILSSRLFLVFVVAGLWGVVLRPGRARRFYSEFNTVCLLCLSCCLLLV